MGAGDTEPRFTDFCRISAQQKPRHSGDSGQCSIYLQALAGQPTEQAVDDVQPDGQYNPVQVDQHPAQYQHKRLLCCFDGINIANSAPCFHTFSRTVPSGPESIKTTLRKFNGMGRFDSGP